MSWSVFFIGKPDKVVAALQTHTESNPESQKEYSEVLPHLCGIVRMNVGTDDAVEVTATGHGYRMNDVLKQNCSVHVETIGPVLI